MKFFDWLDEAGEVAVVAILSLAVTSCTPPLPGPIVPDAMPDGGCTVLEHAATVRLIRAADGSDARFPCDAGTP